MLSKKSSNLTSTQRDIDITVKKPIATNVKPKITQSTSEIKSKEKKQNTNKVSSKEDSRSKETDSTSLKNQSKEKQSSNKIKSLSKETKPIQVTSQTVNKIIEITKDSNEASQKEASNDVDEIMRNTFKKNILFRLKKRMEKNNNNAQLTLQELEDLINNIENEFYTFFQSNSKGYREKYKIIALNINDEKNDSFFLKILHGKIAPKDLPRMKNEDMASDERIAQLQREREKDLEIREHFSNEIAESAVRLVRGEHVEKGLPNINEDDFKHIENCFLDKKREEVIVPRNPLEETYKNLSLGLSINANNSIGSQVLLSKTLELNDQTSETENSILNTKISIDERIQENIIDEKRNEEKAKSSPVKDYSCSSSSSLSLVLPNYTNLTVSPPVLLHESLVGIEESEKELIVISEVHPKPLVTTNSKDTTHEHSKHSFDINCKLCTDPIKRRSLGIRFAIIFLQIETNFFYKLAPIFIQLYRKFSLKGAFHCNRCHLI